MLTAPGLLEECVATKLTTFAINIPADMLSDVQMSLSYSLFGSDKVKFNSWGDQHTSFNLTDGGATLSDYEVKHGWDAVGHWSTRLPCTSVPCARKCIETYLDPLQYYYAQPKKSEFKSCVGACDGVHAMGDYKTRKCITENASEKTTGTAKTTDTAESSTASSGTAGTTGLASGTIGSIPLYKLGLSFAATALLLSR